ncbi:exodeoxyribonuclease VII large subunit [Entomomonas asaccharolytica]|uniref:Exodeoxyribonuclease 7 large subunit n=1 Tax=Entomomonas asaccharolytica TaxID=2785331 RepID=A0A974NE74_9GAMM|nr:exodeoxyribonuclease VII large subunit [Entomomonas asaccharolytica]QQP84849.1 exodeoxyribonuclease VII large subunit [Entomomonas asaccharolytica]
MAIDPFNRLSVNQEVLTVTQLNRCARSMLEEVFAGVWVVGEISNLAKPASGHIYFTLKDQDAQIRCALFRQHALRVREALRDGVAIKVYGKVSIFEGRGDYQLIVERLEPAGDGSLKLAFELLQKKLQQEGLFAAEIKKSLPKHPKRIGVVTSPTGAVIRDIVSVFKRRAPQVELVLVPTAVQGKEAIPQLIKALQLADKQGFDAIILARGGGSLEDLWSFNEEAVARAIAACITPIVSGVGHETDVTIADFVADTRAPTPSAAAELLAPHHQDWLATLNQLQQRLERTIRERLTRYQITVEGLTKRLRHPRDQLQQQAQRIDDLEMRLVRNIKQQLVSYWQQLTQLETRLLAQHPNKQLESSQQQIIILQQQLKRSMQDKLKQLQLQLASQVQALQIISPLATLQRGYSIVLTEKGQVVQDAATTTIGQKLKVKFSKGELQVTVIDNQQHPVNLSLLDD